jgi:hypothetical protein
MLEEFWDEYDLLADNAASASYKLIPNALKRWLSLLDGELIVSNEIAPLESSADFEKWLADCEATQGSMLGSAILAFPIKKEEWLGSHLFLIRKAAADESIAIDIGHTFLTTENGFDAMVREFQYQVFSPLRVELRRYLERKLASIQAPAQNTNTVPASDRVVRLDHNSNTYTEAIQALNRVRDAVAESNEYADQDDKGQRVAELDASLVLLDSPQVRVSVVQTLVIRCLKYLGDKFVEGIVAVLVSAAIAALAAIFGFHLLA